jgi:hypothetical protein
MSDKPEIQFDALLDINDPDFATKFADAIGLQPGEGITFSTPQFERTDGMSVPLPICDFDRLPELSEATLKAIGCQKWDEPDADGNVLWLYPAEWYPHIPDGTTITDINGTTERFKRGETDDDMRYGALAYGVNRKAQGNQS